MFILDYQSTTGNETTLSHSSKTILKFGPQAKNSRVAFLNLQAERCDENTSSRYHCIEVCNDSTPIIQHCNITSQSNCKLLISNSLCQRFPLLFFYFLCFFITKIYKYLLLQILFCFKFKIFNLTVTLLSLGSAAVHIHGSGAAPKMYNCKISECSNVGLFISDGAQGVYEENDISANRLAGVWVKAGANPIMRRNEVHHGKDAGFFIFDGGMVGIYYCRGFN